MRRVVLLLLVAGCGFPSPDVRNDASVDTAPCTAWETRGGHVEDLCTLEPAGSWQINSAVTYNTDEGTVSSGLSPRSFLVDQANGLRLRVISIDNLEVGAGASLRVIGPHPLLMLSWGTIGVAGTIDVSSQAAFTAPGAGANRQSCFAAGDGQGTSAAGGGGGGGFQEEGKRGGNGNTGISLNPGGTPGARLMRPVGAVMGGCAGGNGGGTSGSGGLGGAGGGAIQLTARVSITIGPSAKIHAGGMGGTGAPGNGGGGGGGSGGYIGLDAPMVTVMGVGSSGALLAANGGAGGAGCLSGPGAAGQDGREANMAATGGMGTSCISGADGGNGGSRGQAVGAGVDSMFSGGGGGGSYGHIIVWAPGTGYTPQSGSIRTPTEVLVMGTER